MALTFLLVLLTLATLCTRLHRNFRRSESIYWGPTADSQDTVAGEKHPSPGLASPPPPRAPGVPALHRFRLPTAVLKRRLLMAPRRVKRSRRRPLLPPTPDSGPDGESSD
jgi:hypothetical protein